MSTAAKRAKAPEETKSSVARVERTSSGAARNAGATRSQGKRVDVSASEKPCPVPL
jgi:hypothetical protein